MHAGSVGKKAFWQCFIPIPLVEVNCGSQHFPKGPMPSLHLVAIWIVRHCLYFSDVEYLCHILYYMAGQFSRVVGE